MLDRAKVIILLLLVAGSCSRVDRYSGYKIKSLEKVGVNFYNSIYKSINDTLRRRAAFKIGYYQYLGNTKRFMVDSLVCFNNKSDRLIGCILMQQTLSDGKGDDIDILLGEKINGTWQFWTGTNLFVERKISEQVTSFAELHQIALQDVFSGYLLPNGEINEQWFTSQFEGPGWYKWDETPEQVKKLTRKDFEQRHLEYVRRMWEGRDTTKILP